ncbi:MAG: hypothetical protein DLM67_09560 [Candidatus Nephthysia bennettiae]|uniref:Uncharacterized protein n=1 Tax=Candidatus Aeolococcus gillhamiae TaxID=3127015 RepID=A0A934N6A8_9BACT|nr:hypothetical protein [Candidatus Dormibacteraeota bacterium]PZR96347.1 MAG: hypothetical protein DLM67_09560 [Candidatus Dormibacteraeota bacterium]
MAIESANERAAGGAGSEAGGWLSASAAATAAYALLVALLVVVIYFEDHSVLVPLVVFSGAGFVVAAVMAATRRRWTAWLAAAYSVITLAADGPHQVPAILHPVSATHAVGGVILIVAGVTAIAIAVRAGVRR